MKIITFDYFSDDMPLLGLYQVDPHRLAGLMSPLILIASFIGFKEHRGWVFFLRGSHMDLIVELFEASAH